MSNVHEIPLGTGLRIVGAEGGEVFDVAGVRLTWKVKGDETGYAFSMYEQVLKPGDGVPLHCHACGEVFHILGGTVDFLRITADGEEWVACSSGETVIVPINTPHAFYNRTANPARLLSISTQLHQEFLDAVAQAERSGSFADVAREEALMHIAQMAPRFDMHFFPFSPPGPRR